MQTAGQYFDGQTAGSKACTLTLVGDHLQINQAQHSLAAVHVEAPVGRGKWRVDLHAGASVTFDSTEFGQALLAANGQSNWAGLLESRWRWAAAAVVVAVVGTWGLLTYGIPVAAKHIAYTMPQNLSQELSDSGLQLLDRSIFSPSELPVASRNRVQRLFDRIIESDDSFADYRLVFRASRVGPNAFAIPGGTVVMTDELIALAESDDELTAVLAHEVGHLAGRHSMRILLQNASSAALIAGLTGDLGSITALSATIPTVLMQAKYSRVFETEADEFAFAYMETNGIDTAALSKLLLRLETSLGVDADRPDSWLSSHPAARDRIQERDQNR